MEPLMVEQMQNLVDKHTSVRQGRAVGLFGCLDLISSDGNMIQDLHEPPRDKITAFKQAMKANGLHGLLRPPLLHCAPPLIIKEDELMEGFSRLDKALNTLDF